MNNTSPAAKSTPRDVFLHLLTMIALYLSVFSFIILLYQYIELSFPDELKPYRVMFYDSIRWSVSALIITWPLYLFLAWLYNKEVKQQAERREIKIRKWLVYLTLLISAVAIIVQLIRLIYNFLSGELTISFTLKLLTILVVAAAVFIYYFWDLKRDLQKTQKVVKITAWVSGLLVLLVIIAGFFIAGSPNKQRLVRLDERRITDLQNIQFQIVEYWRLKEKLPASLAELTDNISGYRAPQDPVNKTDYEYSVKGGLQFEICANFQTEGTVTEGVTAPESPYGSSLENWQHTAGRVCFDRTIDPERFPPYPEKTKTPRPTP